MERFRATDTQVLLCSEIGGEGRRPAVVRVDPDPGAVALAVGALSILCTTNMEFLGISGEIGVGVGAPVEVYVQYSRTWTAGGQ